MSEFKFTLPNGGTVAGKNGRSSTLCAAWKWGILMNDRGDVVLFRTQRHAVLYARYMWGDHCHFALVRYCTNGSKS